MSKSESTPLVSIVLTTYNGQTFLKEQLDSLISQSYPNIEIIAVDDGSTDDTVRILNDYAARHPDMKVTVNEANLGFIKNFEKGCLISRGDLIAFCDQDDYWKPDKIEKMASNIGEHHMIFCDSRLCGHELQDLGRNISDIVNFRSFDNCLQLSVLCRMYGHTLLITRALFNYAYPFLEMIPHDWWLPYTATLHGGIKFLPEPLVLYRQHASNVYGVIGGKRKNKNRRDRARKRLEILHIRQRMKIFYDSCPAHLAYEKRVLGALERSYRSFSPINNFRRMFLFFSHYKVLLTVKKYSDFRKCLFCIKMFVKIK